MELDLHKLAVRVMYLYSKYDTNFRNIKLVSVEPNAEYPASDMVSFKIQIIDLLNLSPNSVANLNDRNE